MPMDNENELLSFNGSRQVYRMLVMYYQDRRKQSEIAAATGLSVTTVNRMIRQGRESGMVEITITSPFLSAHQLEKDLARAGGLSEAVVAPNVTRADDAELRVVGAAAFLLSRLRDGDVIAITGGKGVSALVEALAPARKYQVEVVPALGCVQGKHYTDVNHVASEMAARLGGRAWQIHAPLFADTPSQREWLMGISGVDQVLQKAREASDSIETSGARSELLAWLLDETGLPARFADNQRLVGLTLPELQRIPFSFAVAAGSNKIDPIHCALRGGYLKGLVTDEATAAGVIDQFGTSGGHHG
ncbi:sugar-binding transcriptional regulator [Sodalis sp. (in: enterobacteria)]|uniref:sugar-binding transcriptional regulator n=1 Tax=Sodalis sp. (in: enterobacteria) TaxID=1898979 RepID=UPI003F3F2A29